ncbi:MAG: glycerol-3-phosphate 1-O-acyltransferase PlsY [Oscillospiraceae bacterium]|nr:glycerol-3-phosphate 1-O-acyltransferase PlsY [Oscillospiraceae bacterium]
MIYRKLAFIFIVSYLIGSLSFAIIISKVFYKKDIRTFGSGNAGMTNMLRTFGKGAAAATFIGDFLKGTVSVVFARMMMAQYWPIMNMHHAEHMFFRDVAVYLAIGGALLGHLKPLYFGFKGGKGISVAFGAMMAAQPLLTSMAFAVWVVVVMASKMVSLASICAVVFFGIATFVNFKITGRFSAPNAFAAVVFPAVIVYAHRSNIQRIMNGTERKLGQKKQ